MKHCITPRLVAYTQVSCQYLSKFRSFLMSLLPPSSYFRLAQCKSGSVSITTFTTCHSVSSLSTILRILRMIQCRRMLIDFLTGGLGASY
jgi:hypothetical protein